MQSLKSDGKGTYDTMTPETDPVKLRAKIRRLEKELAELKSWEGAETTRVEVEPGVIDAGRIREAAKAVLLGLDTMFSFGDERTQVITMPGGTYAFYRGYSRKNRKSMEKTIVEVLEKFETGAREQLSRRRT